MVANLIAAFTDLRILLLILRFFYILHGAINMQGLYESVLPCYVRERKVVQSVLSRDQDVEPGNQVPAQTHARPIA